MAETDRVFQLLNDLDQQHIYESFSDFSPSHPIYKQVASLNLERSLEHFKSANSAESNKSGDKFQPVSKVVNLQTTPDSKLDEFSQVGMEAIRAGTVAAVIMSGGQGTRLGYSGPKGMFNLGMPSQKTIFQLHMEKILKMKQLSNASSVPVYIMTSHLNHDIIMNAFHDNNYFNSPKEDIIFFEQGIEPSFTLDGKIIIESKETLSLAPDGNGGIYRALLYSGCIDNMKNRNIQHLHIYGIDNVLTKSIDPLFIGICINNHVECGNKVVWRKNQTEKVGVTVECNEHMHILEYSELPIDLADSIDKDTNKLIYGAANICNHYLNFEFLSNIILPSLSEIYHIAKKKIPYLDLNTNCTIQPEVINGVKLEMFVFDVFPLAREWVVVEGLREDEFAPVKNAPGDKQVE